MADTAAPGALAVRGLADLQRAFKIAEKELKVELRVELLRVAKPVRVAAEQLAVAKITNIDKNPGGPRWEQMRTGVTQKLVYVAPKQRGQKKGPRKRPRFGTFLMEKAMAPALEQNRMLVVQGMERLIDNVGRKWERA